MGAPDKSRREKAVREYIAQGLIKWPEAMRKAGYAETYIHIHGHKVLAAVSSSGQLAGIKADLEQKAVDYAAVSLEEVIANARWLITHGKGGVDGIKHGNDVAAGNLQLGRIIAAFTDVQEEKRDGELRLTEAEWAARQAEEAETERKMLRFGDALAV